MGASQANFNSHPELTDDQWAKAVGAIYWGDTSEVGISNTINYLAQEGGRYNVYKAWSTNSTAGNPNDPWFYNIPPWTPLVLIPVLVATGIGLVWFLWGKDIKRAFKNAESSNGSDSSYD